LIHCTQENELILTAVLDGLYEALNTLLRGQTERRNILDSLELVRDPFPTPIHIPTGFLAQAKCSFGSGQFWSLDSANLRQSALTIF
jgi:hypothetical protein